MAEIPAISWALVRAQLYFCAFLILLTIAWCTYRELYKRRLRHAGNLGTKLVCRCPDDTPRKLLQYGYCPSWPGFLIIHCWTAVLVVSYLLVIWGCWMSYVIASDLYFPPSQQFWLETFKSWDGIMFPWCVLFVLSHLCLVGVLIFWDAMRSHSMLPADSMGSASHLMVQEMTIEADAPRAFGVVGLCFALSRYLRRLRARQILPIQKSEGGTRFVEHMCVRYIYCETEGSFVLPSQSLPTARKMHEILQSGGLTTDEAMKCMERSGCNAIHVRVPGRLESLVMEFSNFYYVVNSVAFLTYIAFTTWNIGTMWFLMTLGAGVYRGLMITRPNQQKVAELAKVHQRCKVLRDHTWKEVDVSEIVLGDIVQVEGMHAQIPCDGLLISGSLIVNESMLTGEPMPVAKVPVENVENYEIRAKGNKTYAGTCVIESEGEDGHALIYCTDVGALTTRGQLVRMVLFPTAVRFKYLDQLPIVYGLMCIYATLIAAYKSAFLDEGSAVAKFLSIICSFIGALSPMLPVSLVMGQSVSATRLGKSTGEYQIKCLQPGRIPVAGKISTMVFDKTGTITKSGMDLTAVQPAQHARFEPKVHLETSDISDGQLVTLRRGLAVCHTVKELQDGRLVGNELECAMVRRMGGLEQSDDMQILRELHFDHVSMTSGVVIRSGGLLEAFVKGSPEMIKRRCTSSSLPPDYDSMVMRYAKANFYTISICHKTLPPMTEKQIAELPRTELEEKLRFVGLLLFQNEMKLEAPQAIEKLKEGAIRSVICTGDNELTGIAIGKQCGIVTRTCLVARIDQDGRLVFSDPDKEDHPVDLHSHPDCQVALSRSAWQYLCQHPEMLQGLWPRCVVFGRMQPNDKINVIKYFQSQGLIVGMAGDGGNDCGALRASHAGIALSHAEASLVAPFSSGRLEKNSDQISLLTVPDLIREGRACLATNLATFSYFIVQALSTYTMQSITMVDHNVVFGEWVFILKDIGLGMVMAFYMTRSRALPFLVKIRPTATLLGIRTMSTIATQVVLNVVLFLVARQLMYSQPWYEPLNPAMDIHVPPYMWMLRGDNYDGALNAICCTASLATVAYVHTYGGNFRRNVCQNVGINIIYLLVMALLCVLTLSPPNPFNCIFRVNCDTPNSLACAGLPVLDALSVGGVGDCFVGPQVKTWQNHTKSYAEEVWLPALEKQCLPPSRTLEFLPAEHPPISTGKGFSRCLGPNNCFAVDFKWILISLLAFHALLHHVFMKFVLLGPVARYIRQWSSKGVTQGLSSFDSICPEKGASFVATATADKEDLERG